MWVDGLEERSGGSQIDSAAVCGDFKLMATERHDNVRRLAKFTSFGM